MGEEGPAPGVASVAPVEDTIIFLPEGIALWEADVQLRPDPRDDFQSQITEQEASCGGLNTCPQIPCGLPLNLGGPLVPGEERPYGLPAPCLGRLLWEPQAVLYFGFPCFMTYAASV